MHKERDLVITENTINGITEFADIVVIPINSENASARQVTSIAKCAENKDILTAEEDGEKLNHLSFLDDLKLFTKNENK